MPKVGICTQLPYSLILGFDWQQQVQARCIYEPNGSLSIPSAFHFHDCIQASRPSISRITSNELSLPALDDAILPVAAPSSFHTDTQFIPKPSHRLTEEIIGLENIDAKHESNKTLNAITFPEEDIKFILTTEERSVSEINKNDFLEVPNYEKHKNEEQANNTKPLNKRDNIKVVKMDLSEIRENRPKDKLVLGNSPQRSDRPSDFC
ncbi:hypothetical protein AVEN_93471-1 [Araneus ventricosus]|uniref:Uncharacterized protein n=1 Tax=Araneus ventricosus TaxID=182803 RepID=A0A4Y2APM3_ARAVE|nr:hypothetical protein AVEN_93471-1 [Araneus ventricosus]